MFRQYLPSQLGNPTQFKTILLTCALALISFNTQAIDSGNWNRFRGNNGSGLSDAKTIPVEFTESNTQWKTELKGSGHSSPVVWKNQIYLLSANTDKEGERSLICFSSETGKELWRVEDPYDAHHTNKKLNTFASCTPVTAADGVYFISSTGEKMSIRSVTHDGKDRWKQHLDAYTSDHGSASSPILVDGVVIVNTDSKETRRNHVVGIDASNGKILWSRERIDPASDKLPHKTVYSTPIIVMMGGQKTVTLVSTHHGWLGLDPKTGKTIWQHKENYPNRSVGSPVEKDGVIFATLGASGNGKLSDAFRINDTGKIEVLYSLDKTGGLGYVPTPLFIDDLLYLWSDKGMLTCREALTGKEVYSEKVGGIYFSSPIAINGRIYCTTRDGKMAVIKAGRDFQVLARNDLGADVFATPAIANGHLIIRTKTHLISIGNSPKGTN